VQNIIPSYDLEPNTLYQKFAFLSSFLGSEEFMESVTRVINSPVTKWKYYEKTSDIRNLDKIDSKAIKQIASSKTRVPVPSDNLLSLKFNSLPSRVFTTEKHDSLDTPENQFVKFTLTEYFIICSEVSLRLHPESREKREAEIIADRLQYILDNPMFKEISNPHSLDLNSPVLQRKEGYREIYRIWLMFDIGSKLVWTGGDDVYSAGKKDVALLYEYWVYFKLLSIVESIFSLTKESHNNLLALTNDGLNLNLKSGFQTVVEGISNYGLRKLNFEFNYNKTFSGQDDFLQQGSWTRNMRPDYSLSIWPSGISIEEAEKQELIVHIHFDAKYRVENLTQIFGPENSSEEMNTVLNDENRGVHKRSDLLKMHAYKDAIRRTAGAYIIYPGSQNVKWRGFHEIIPGLGAFTLRPDKGNDGSLELANFIKAVVDQQLNRASQYERLTYHINEVYKTSPAYINEKLPEYLDGNRITPPAELFVLIGFCKSHEHRQWIEKNHLYNVRLGGSFQNAYLHLNPNEALSSFLLLHQTNELITNDIWRIKTQGPKVFSKIDLLNRGYPDPSTEYYFVYEIEPIDENSFDSMKWDIRKLKNFSGGRQSGWPFAVTLSELMQVKIK